MLQHVQTHAMIKYMVWVNFANNGVTAIQFYMLLSLLEVNLTYW